MKTITIILVTIFAVIGGLMGIALVSGLFEDSDSDEERAFGLKMTTSLSDAAITAETAVGNGSQAVAAELEEKNGYLTYDIMVVDAGNNISKVVVDSGTGQVILSEKISKKKHI
jgi:hypothetical protein